MTEPRLATYIRRDGIILYGEEAEEEIARRDAQDILQELGMEPSNTHANNRETSDGQSSADNQTPVNGPSPPAGGDGNPPRGDPTGSDLPPDQPPSGNPPEHSGVLGDEDENPAQILVDETIAVWKFSKGAESNVYHFSLDLDALQEKLLGHVNSLHHEINRLFHEVTSSLGSAEDAVEYVKDAVKKWSDIAGIIKSSSESVKSSIHEKAGELKSFTEGVNSKVQRMSKFTQGVLTNPDVNRFVDLTEEADAVGKMAQTTENLTTSFGNFVDENVKSLINVVDNFSSKVIEFINNNRQFQFILKAGKKIVKILEKISSCIKKVREFVSGCLQRINEVFGKLFTVVAKIQSVLVIFALDFGLLKEALKNGTIRPYSLQTLMWLGVQDHVTVESKSSCDIMGAKVTALTATVAKKVEDNSVSGNIDVDGAEVNALNADIALKREGNFKRHNVYAKGAQVNIGNAKATLVDNRDGDTSRVGVSGVELNAFNVEASLLGRKGTENIATAAGGSVNVGNVQFGIRRKFSAVTKAGPAFSAFNVDLTLGPPSLQNVIGPGVGFCNFSIPFFGSGVMGDGGSGGGSGGETAEQPSNEGSGSTDTNGSGSSAGGSQNNVGGNSTNVYRPTLPSSGGLETDYGALKDRSDWRERYTSERNQADSSDNEGASGQVSNQISPPDGNSGGDEERSYGAIGPRESRDVRTGNDWSQNTSRDSSNEGSGSTNTNNSGSSAGGSQNNVDRNSTNVYRPTLPSSWGLETADSSDNEGASGQFSNQISSRDANSGGAEERSYGVIGPRESRDVPTGNDWSENTSRDSAHHSFKSEISQAFREDNGFSSSSGPPDCRANQMPNERNVGLHNFGGNILPTESTGLRNDKIHGPSDGSETGIENETRNGLPSAYIGLQKEGKSRLQNAKNRMPDNEKTVGRTGRERSSELPVAKSTQSTSTRTRHQAVLGSILHESLGLRNQNDKATDKRENKTTKKSEERTTREECKEQMLKECKKELGLENAEENTKKTDKTGKDESKPQEVKIKKKPWGANKNIHGFDTLGTESTKSTKKISGTIFGFQD